MSTEIRLPVPVLTMPHWRVNIRPEGYRATAIPTLAECFSVVEQATVRLRGWDYPAVSREDGEHGQGSNWVASWCAFRGHVEYWRLYQSTQFIHLFAIPEDSVPGWKEKLRATAGGHIGTRNAVDWSQVPGFLSVLNFLYTVTEIFEFSGRAAQRGVYVGNTTIDIALIGVRDFVLTADSDRAWPYYHASHEDTLRNSWSIPANEIIASATDHALDAVIWFFERFGWLQPSRDTLRHDQSNFLRKGP